MSHRAEDFVTPPAAWPRRLLARTAWFRVMRLADRLGRAGRVEAEQEAARRNLIRRMSGTAHGRATGLEAGMSYTEFRMTVPVRRYEDLVPWIERAKRAEPGVLWPGRCAHFAVSSGTTAGRTKFIPVTTEMIGHFRQAGLDSLCLHALRRRDPGVFLGRHLFLGGSTALSPLTEAAPHRAWSGDLSGITALNLPAWVEKHLYEPGREIALMADWPAKLEAIVARTRALDLTLVAGIPGWLLILAERLRAATGRPHLRALWPRLECLIHGGVPLGPFADELREAAGPGVDFHEVYPASEAFIAAQDSEPEAGLRLLTDAGVFFEFVPLAGFSEERLGEAGAAALRCWETRPGVDYVLLLTTPGGLCRYVIGDVVRFTTTEPPRLVYAGRTRLQLSAFGEHVIEKELTDALTRAASLFGAAVVNFHVAPLFPSGPGGRGRHEWWIELRSAGGAVAPAAFGAALDAGLQAGNEDYEAKRRGGGMEDPLVRLVPAGTFELWLRARGRWGGQNKMPRCRSDRAIADDLARLASSQ
jgi:hypothetical protein